MAYRRVAEDGESAVDVAVTEIRRRIRGGELVPGQRLVAAELAALLSISGGPIREALTRLAGEGIVDIQAHRGAIVRTQTPDDVAEIFALREVVEGLAARLAARAVASGNADVTPLNQAVDLYRTMADKLDYFGYARANQAFHEAVYALAKRPRVSTLARQLSDQIDRLNNVRLARPSVLTESSKEHDAVAQAILAGDEAGAEKAMRKHVVKAADKVTGTV
jgi:DNA-binding GntR family transcriptional regulator